MSLIEADVTTHNYNEHNHDDDAAFTGVRFSPPINLNVIDPIANIDEMRHTLL